MWTCSNCQEKVEDQFEICWNCQFAMDGTPQPIHDQIAEATKAVLRTHLQTSESLRHWAYGVKPLSLRMKLLLSFLGLIWAMLLPFSLQAYYSPPSGRDASSRITTWLLFGVLAFLFYKLAQPAVMKRCIVGLTNQRFIAVECGDDLSIKKMFNYPLDHISSVKTRTEPKQAKLEIGDRHRSFKAIFAEAELPENLSQAEEIIEILETIRTKAAEKEQKDKGIR
jgi:hypothetical protein